MPGSPISAIRKPRLPLGWHVVGGALVAFWLVVMGMMFIGPGDLEAIALTGGDLSAGFAEGEEWMGAYHAGRKLGYVHSVTRREADRLHLSQESHLEIQVGGTRQKVATDLRVILGQNFYLESFEFELRTGILDLQAAGKMEGEKLVVEITLGEETSRKTWRLEEPPMFDLAIPKILAQHNLRPGQRFRVTLFDPQTMSNQPTVIEVVGREAISMKGVLVPAVRLKRTAAGVSTDTWISEAGEVLRQEHGIGLILQRESREQATRLSGRAGVGTPDGEFLMRRLLPDKDLIEERERVEAERAGE